MIGSRRQSGKGHVLDRGANETRVIVPVSASVDGVGHTLVLDVALEGSLWPAGICAFDAREFQDALRAPVQIDDPAARPSVLVRAMPAERPAAPPDNPGDGVAAAGAVFAAPPTSVEDEPFGWASYDLSPEGAVVLVLPTLLSAAARELRSMREPDDASAQVYVSASRGGHEWYGIDISDGARLWCAAPSRDVAQRPEAIA